MDDWISHVYSPSRTFKDERFRVEHHTTHHGQRYEVDQNNKRHLQPNINTGRKKIEAYAADNGFAIEPLKDGVDKKQYFKFMPGSEWTGIPPD